MLSNKRKGNFHISAPSLLWENLTQNVLGRLEWWLPHSDFLGLCLWHLLIIYLWFLRVDAMIALAYKWKVEAMLRAVWATYNKDEVVAAEWQWVWPRQAVFYSARTPCWKQPKCLKFFSRHVGVPFFWNNHMNWSSRAEKSGRYNSSPKDPNSRRPQKLAVSPF